MRITASHIASWADVRAKEAQQELPRLVRRLCFEPGQTQQLTFPAGDSTYLPGWDGVLRTSGGSAWVPAGDSRWELGCDQDVPGKANREYKKRLAQTDEPTRQGATFVFVTPRRWPGKDRWVAEKKLQGEWSDVRAYDAVDLEQWLEQSPAVALQFAEELGLSGRGVENPEQYWQSWSGQSNPPISPEALTHSREEIRDRILASIEKLLQEETPQPLPIQADSVEEAIAFVAATLINHQRLLNQAVVVTQPEGWRYVEANLGVRIAIAAGAEAAAAAVVRKGLLVIIPHATGDQMKSFKDRGLLLERPDIYEFEKALVSIGMEESDAKRYALGTGRSWTVLRRQLATNPALSHPAWLDCPPADSLLTLCLLGAWKADKEADRLVVERLAGKAYEQIESDLRYLSTLDDPPVLRIGSVWRAKSPLELLSLYGSRITTGQLDRFFKIAAELLSTPDPQLELPDQERYAAQIHGKVHPHSGLLFDSLCDALIKLAARGPELSSLREQNIEARVGSLVRDLLSYADEVRWLSLASYLPALAEASPDIFLAAVEDSLSQREPAIHRLLTESSSGMFGSCWHSGLLWALESLAWSPRRMLRVALILARLCHVQIGGNWGNRPSASLLGIFRTWLPQTAAQLEKRIEALDQLIKRQPEAAFELLQALCSEGLQHASPASRPKWRDDDAGTGNGVSDEEHFAMLEAAWKRALAMSERNPSRIAALLREACGRNHPRVSQVIQLVEPLLPAALTDEDRDLLRGTLRNILHWHANYDDSEPAFLAPWMATITSLYERLGPADLVSRHRWLFDSHWTELPEKDDESPRGDRLAEARIAALDEIFRTDSFEGLNRLVRDCRSPYTVGGAISGLCLSTADLSRWITEFGEEFDASSASSHCISGLLNRLPPESLEPLLDALIKTATEQGWDSRKWVSLLCLIHSCRKIWELVDTLGAEVAQTYWNRIEAGRSHFDEAADLNFVLEKLLEAGRPRAALELSQYDLPRTEPSLLLRTIQTLLATPEADGPLIDSWHLGEIFESLEKSPVASRELLIQVEFSLFEALGYGQEQRAATLLSAVMSDPVLFTELIGLCYKPGRGYPEEMGEIDEKRRALARIARKVLRACRQLPGQNDNDAFDDQKFNLFVETAIHSCEQSGRQEPCQYHLGEVLARSCGFGSTDLPAPAVLEFLDRPDMAKLRRGFCFGTWNDRGMTSRDPRAGGEQERHLAKLYRSKSEQLQSQYPQVAAMYESIAKHYDIDGEREDIEAKLRQEEF